MSVRPAREADAEALAAVHAHAWTVSYAGLADPARVVDRPVEERVERWRGACRGEGPPVWVAEDERGHVVGFVAAGASRDGQDAADVGEVVALYVDPDAQRRGHGAALLDRAVTALRAAGFARATLWTLTANDRSRGLYRAQGWREDGAERTHPRGFRETRYARSLD